LVGGSARLAAGTEPAAARRGGGLQRLEFMAVPEAKRVKNRVHIDFGADDVQAAIDRLVAMGATIAWEENFPPELGYRNLVLRDPEGNEFCVGGPRTDE
jgi:predicted enzyme related to lactoylglutathione lyase